MIFDIIVFIVAWLLGFAVCRAWQKRDATGDILIVQQDGQKYLMLEIYKGHADDIYPGSIVKLGVREEDMRK